MASAILRGTLATIASFGEKSDDDEGDDDAQARLEPPDLTKALRLILTMARAPRFPTARRLAQFAGTLLARRTQTRLDDLLEDADDATDLVELADLMGTVEELGANVGGFRAQLARELRKKASSALLDLPAQREPRAEEVGPGLQRAYLLQKLGLGAGLYEQALRRSLPVIDRVRLPITTDVLEDALPAVHRLLLTSSDERNTTLPGALFAAERTLLAGLQRQVLISRRPSWVALVLDARQILGERPASGAVEVMMRQLLREQNGDGRWLDTDEDDQAIDVTPLVVTALAGVTPRASPRAQPNLRLIKRLRRKR